MPRKAKAESPNWSTESTLAALRAIPAPLTTQEQAEAFHDAVNAVQEVPRRADMTALVVPASAEIVRVVNATLASRSASKFESAILFGLKMLAHMGSKAGHDTIVRTARSGFAKDSYMWTVVLGPYGEGHPGAKELFAALSDPLPDDFMGICLLDAANEAAREHKLRKHPFDSKQGEERLTKLLKDRREEKESYAVSACASLPFLAPARQKKLFALGRKHIHEGIRMEVAWASAMTGDAEGLKYLAAACLDPNRSIQARTYLTELKKTKLIPQAALVPDFAATSDMCEWLAHPNEFGESPSRIELVDKRTLHWPPTNDTREMRIFRYEYDKSEHRPKRDIGIGMVGSITFALFGETTAKMKPEEIYGIHCCWELEANEDKRAPKKRSGAAGWKMIQKG